MAAKRATPDLSQILEANTLFSGLGRATIDKIVAAARLVPLKQSQVLFRAGDSGNGCFAVCSGVLKASLFDEDGNETLIAVLGKGDIIGEMALVDRQPRSATITALKPAELAHIATSDFERIADANTEIYRHLLRVLSARLRLSNEEKAARELPLAGRLAKVLCRLAEAFGEPLPDGRMLIRQKFSQAQLGQMAGCARENVNRQLGQWREAKLVTQISGYHCIADEKRLVAIIRSA